MDAVNRAKKAEHTIGLLTDELQQIEWRLAMCRSCAVDVNTAHAIAFGALKRLDAGPWMDSASRYTIAKQAELSLKKYGVDRLAK
jgi:hypothetical protein